MPFTPARSIIAPTRAQEPPMTTTYTQHTHAKSLDSVRVAEAMHHGLITCQPNTTLHTIARLIAAQASVAVSGGR
jgi:hypothetical protein